MYVRTSNLGAYCPAPRVWVEPLRRCLSPDNPQVAQYGAKASAAPEPSPNNPTPAAASSAATPEPVAQQQASWQDRVAALQAECEANPAKIWDGMRRLCVDRPGTATARRSCPEGSRWDDAAGDCVCYSGRVWKSDRSMCVSPQSVAQEVRVKPTGSDMTQQPLDPAVKAYLASFGVSVNCKISDNFVATPAGGKPGMVCSVNGGPYEHGAYAINASPASLLNKVKPGWAQQAGESGGGPQNVASPAPAGTNNGGGNQQQGGGGGTTPAPTTQEPPSQSGPGPTQEPTNNGGPQPTTNTPAPTGPTSTTTTVYADQWLDGVPNWIVFAGGVAALFAFGGKKF